MKRKLDASVEASGPHDFAVRISTVRQKHQPRPPHPVPNVRDDRDTPLRWDGMARLIVLIWVRSETECFCKGDWTAQISLIRFNKFGPARFHRRARACPGHHVLALSPQERRGWPGH